jgi:DNA-binding beta-propeller fold protein YncE
MRSPLNFNRLILALALLFLPAQAFAQIVVATVGVVRIAVNPVTNMVYVGNREERSITVIDGNVNSPTQNSVLAVVDGGTNTVITSPLHNIFLGSLGVNPITNRAYMINGSGDFKVEVFDATDISHLTTITLGFGLHALAVNPTTNRIHVTESDLGAVWAIDGSTNTFIRYGLNLSKPFPGPLTVNPVTSFVYVANRGGEPLHGGQSISVIDDPPAPVVQVRALVEKVSSYNLANGVSNSLDSKLQNALAALESLQSGNNGTVCNKLDAFINEVESHKELTTAQAKDLISAATRIKRTLGCG